jgi:cytochrome c peroxidase
MFFAVGFADFDPNNPQITGTVDDESSRGRGGFTGEKADNYKFKVPQLYTQVTSKCRFRA